MNQHVRKSFSVYYHRGPGRQTAHHLIDVWVVEGADHDAFAWGERGHGANVPKRYAERDSSVVSMVAV